MSAILSADDLNDFISPGIACIKPVETLPKQQPKPSNPYEVTTEDEVAASADIPPAQISLTDCLACSGCVTSAEAVLVSLQSHQEVLNTLDAHASVTSVRDGVAVGSEMLFVASVSPQTRASLAAAYGVTERVAGYMIEQLLSGAGGLKSGGRHRSGFTWVFDTNALRDICRAALVEEVTISLAEAPIIDTLIRGEADERPKLPILASACPGWICYAEKTHPYVLPHLSRLKSPQALAGTLVKSVLSRGFGVPPDKIWHLAIMPCFDKKLEASREELTDSYWRPDADEKRGIRDVDCVITARELIMLAETRGINFPGLPRKPVSRPAFPDPILDSQLFPCGHSHRQLRTQAEGPSGGYAYHILRARQAQIPGSEIRVERGRNVDVVEYTLVHKGDIILKTARYFGFRNIQNLVRKLKPVKKSRMPGAKLAGAENRRTRQPSGPAGGVAGLGELAYVEVMACPGGCTNGGGQIKIDDVAGLQGLSEHGGKLGPVEQKQWLAKVDEAYYSAESSNEEDTDMATDGEDAMDIDERPTGPSEAGGNNAHIREFLEHWSSCTGVELDKLLFTSYRQVDSDVGKEKGVSDIERVAGLASAHGGGW